MASRKALLALVEAAIDKDDAAQLALDDMVDDAVRNMAASINNAGAEEQIKFLLKQGYTAEEITKTVEDI